MQTSCFEKSLEMIFGWLSLLLEVMFGSRYACLARVIGSLISATVTNYNSDAVGLSLLPLLVALSALPGTLDGGLGGRDCSRVAQDEGGPNRLLAKSVSGRVVEHLLGSFWPFVAELMNQGATHHAIPEHRHDVSVGHTRKHMALL
jgi:hypothetical protein